MRIPLLVLVALVAAAACVSTENLVPEKPRPKEHYVRNIALDETRGEVGTPFKSRLTYEDNYLRDPEFSFSGLPPDLRFDPKSKQIVGVPQKDGFFTVQIAIRQRIEEDTLHRPEPDDRWWTESVTIEIYKPMK